MRNTDRLTRLINDILDINKIESGKMEIKKKPIDLQQILSQSHSSFDSVSSKQNIKIQTEIEGINHMIYADQDRIEQVIVNIIGNAMKFRGKKAPQVQVSAEKQNGMWLFSVADNGIGIDPVYADRIFLLFQRLCTQDEFPGTGIGLALCKRIVERHGGKIWVESANGAGAVFKFTLPNIS